MNDRPSQDAQGRMPGRKHRLRPAPWQIEDAEEPMSVSGNAPILIARSPAFDKAGNRACQVCGVSQASGNYRRHTVGRADFAGAVLHVAKRDRCGSHLAQ